MEEQEREEPEDQEDQLGAEKHEELKVVGCSREGRVRLLSETDRISSSSQGLGTKGDVIPHPLEAGDPSGPKAQKQCWLSLGCPVMS